MRRQSMKNKLLRYIFSLLFSCFVLNSVLEQADWLYLTGQQLFCLDLIQLFFLQQMQNCILQMLSVIHGDFYGVRFSQRNRLCILNAISFLPEAAHEHTFYRRPWRDKDTITHQSYSNNCIINQFIAIVCSCGSFFFFISADFTLICTLTFLANFSKHVRGSHLICHPSSILNEWLWQASNRRVSRLDTGCCVVEERWAPINKPSFI